MIDVSTHLMFQDGSAREAVERYVGLIPNSTITEVTGPEAPARRSDSRWQTGRSSPSTVR